MNVGAFKILTRVITQIKPTTMGKNIHTAKVAKATFTASDAVMPKPSETRIIEFIGANVAITIGVLLGGCMSKCIAGFLEETELFVPSDDDDDD